MFAQELTVLHIESDPGDPVGLGQTYELNSSNSSFYQPGGVAIYVGDWAVAFLPQSGVVSTTPGVYEGAKSWRTWTPVYPRMLVARGSTECAALSGRFSILEAGSDARGQHLAVDFEQRCDGAPAGLRGYLRFQSSVAVTPRISAGSATAYEGDGESVLPMVVSLSMRSVSTVTVAYATGDGTASAGTDYESVSGIASFAPGQTAIVVNVPIHGNALSQPDRTFALTLSTPSGAPTEFGSATGTILDDDPIPTYLSMRSEAGDYVGAGRAWLYSERDALFAPTTFDPNYPPSPGTVGILVDNGNWALQFSPPLGSTLAPGVYEAPAPGWTATPTSGRLNVSGDGRGCTGTGRFTVLEAEYDSETKPTKLAVDFEQRCYGPSSAPLYGSLRFHSTVPAVPRLSVSGAASYEGDGEPRSLRFFVSLSHPTQRTVTVGYRSVPGSAQEGTDYVAASGLLSFSPGQTALPVDVPILGNTAPQRDRALTLILENPVGASMAFASGAGTIVDDDAITTLLYLDSDPGDYPGGGKKELLRSLDVQFTTTTPEPGHVHAVLQGINWWDVHFVSPDGAPIHPGLYDHTALYPWQIAGVPGMAVEGEGRGCNSATGRYLVLETRYDSLGALQGFAADFEQHCEGAAAALFGSLRINSTIPPTFRLGARAGFHTIPPCRIFDTRVTQDPLLPGVAKSIPVVGLCDVPLTARVLAVNLTSVNAPQAGELRAWAPGLATPDTSVLALAPGRTRAAVGILPIGVGVMTLRADTPGEAPLDVVLDVSGYFE